MKITRSDLEHYGAIWDSTGFTLPQHQEQRLIDDLKSGAFAQRQAARNEPLNGTFYSITTHTEAEWQYYSHKFNTKELFEWEGAKVVVLEMHRWSSYVSGDVTLWAPMPSNQSRQASQPTKDQP